MNNVKTHIGSALVQLMRDEQEVRKINLSEMAELFGMSKPYLTALLSGDRPINKLSSTYLDSIAGFLNIPKAQVYNLAEILSPEDYIHHETIEKSLKEIYKRLISDITWIHLAPSKEAWNAMDMKTQLLIGYMYETISHQKFIKGVKAYKFEGELIDTNDAPKDDEMGTGSAET